MSKVEEQKLLNPSNNSGQDSHKDSQSIDEDAKNLENEFYGKDDARAPANKPTEATAEDPETVGLRTT